MSDVLSGLVAARCLLRGVPLFFSTAPKTPLRVLAIVALDTVHVLRTSRPLQRRRLGELALVLDFQASTNAAWDRKVLCREEYRAMRQRLESVGLGRYIEAYLVRLRALEGRRPSISGDHPIFDDVRVYREEVVRLSLGTLTTIVLGTDGFDEDLDTLYRMALQCQIVDDVMDYGADLSAGLPSYLTATASLPEAMELMARATLDYGERGRGAFPLRIALRCLSAAARFVVRRGPRSRAQLIPRTMPPEPACAGIDPYYLLLDEVPP